MRKKGTITQPLPNLVIPRNEGSAQVTPQTKSPIFVELLAQISPFGRNDTKDAKTFPHNLVIPRNEGS
ncbi:hypothetical protein AKO67_24165, partial [Flavobacterium sp. VMW]